jgi:hypothetical protein
MKQRQEELLLAHLLLLALLSYPLVDFSGNVTHQKAVAHRFRRPLGVFDSTNDSSFSQLLDGFNFPQATASQTWHKLEANTRRTLYTSGRGRSAVAPSPTLVLGGNAGADGIFTIYSPKTHPRAERFPRRKRAYHKKYAEPLSSLL